MPFPENPKEPKATVSEDGTVTYECQEGYTLKQGSNGPFCQKTVVNTRMRAGQAVNRYRSSAAQGSNPQRSKVNTRTLTTGATEVAS